MKHISLLILLIMFSSSTYGQTLGIHDMYIIPSEPTAEDNIQLVIHAVLPMLPCQLVVDDTEVVIMDNEIKVITQYWTGFFTSFCLSIDTIELGYFGDGHYHLTCNYDHKVYTDSDSLTFTVGTPTNIGVNENGENGIHLYPNPAIESISIKMDVSVPSDVSMKIYDTHGKLVSNPNLGYKAHGEHTIPINVSNLSNGLYLMKISAGENFTITKRFMKQ